MDWQLFRWSIGLGTFAGGISWGMQGEFGTAVWVSFLVTALLTALLGPMLLSFWDGE